MKTIKIKRAYDEWELEDGYRILVDRLWPRGVSKEKAKIDEWAKNITPSTEIRKQWHNGEITWNEFGQKYNQELDVNAEFAPWRETVLQKAKTQQITLVTGAKLKPHCHVDILLERIEKEIK